MSAISRRFPKPSSEIGAPVPSRLHHTCLDCPAFGSEECRALQELGMYCDTVVAAWEAARPGSRSGRSGLRARRGLVAVPA